MQLQPLSNLSLFQCYVMYQNSLRALANQWAIFSIISWTSLFNVTPDQNNIWEFNNW